MADIASLQVVVNADTSAAERSLDSFGAKVGSVGSTVTAALGGALIGATAAVGAAFVGSAKSAADFEKQMSSVSAVSGASASELDALTKSALQLGKDTSFSATEAAQGIEELVKAGVSVQDVLGGGARAALDLAAAGAIDVGSAAEIAANAMNVFGKEGSEMGHVVDIIAGAANASAISVNDYKFSLSAAGAVAAAVGIDFESLSTAIAVMGQAGIKGSDAGTSLKTMMMNLQPATKAQWKEFTKLGIVTADGANQFFTAEGKAKDFAQIAGVLQTAMAGMTKQQQLASLEILFGSDAIRAGAVLLEAGTAGFENMAEAMGKVTAQQVAEERLNNLWGSVEKLKGSLETAAIMLGGAFTPALKQMADVANVYVGQAIEIIEQLPDAWRTVGEAFAGEWEPSETLTPFMNAVGEIGLAVGVMYNTVSVLIAQLGVVITKVLAGDIPAAFQAWLVYLGTIYSLLMPILTQWAQAFVDWVAPMIPPLLAALAGAALALVGWIEEQIPPLLAQLALWGQAFVDWVAPMIPPLLEALGKMLADMLKWLGDQVATMATALYQWFTDTIAAIDWAGLATSTGALLGTMMGEAIVSLANSGPIIAEWLTTITDTIAAIDWGTIGRTTGELMVTMTVAAIGLIVGAAMVLAAWTNAFISTLKAITWADVTNTLSALLVGVITAVLGLAELLNAFTTGFTTAIVKGITGMSPTEAISALVTWVQGVIDKALGAIKFSLPMPSFSGGGAGGGGATPMSYSSGGGGPDDPVAYLRQAALARGIDPDQVERVMMSEGPGGWGATGTFNTGTSYGPLQLHYAGGPNPQAGMGDAFTRSTGIDLRTDKSVAAGQAAIDYALDQLSRTGDYREWYGADPALGSRFTPVRRVAPSTAPMNKMMPGGDPSHWPPMIQEVIDVAPDWQTAMAQISTDGQMAYSQVMTAGTAAGMALVTSSTDDLGNVTRIYSDATGVIGATITSAAGEIVNSWGSMATAVPAQTEAMAQTALTSVTNMGAGIMTTTHDSAGSVITTITDMQGQVTSQYATLANGAVLTMGDMAAGVLTSTTDMGTGIMTTVQDMSGNYITTITDLQGNVTSQYTTLASSATAATAEMGAGVTAEVAAMSQETLTSVTDMGTGTLTITQNAAGEMVATITDMAGNVTSQYTTMGSDVTGSVEEMGNTVVEQMGDVNSAFEDSSSPIEGFQDALNSVEPPDFGDIVDELKDVQKAAEKAADAIKDINSAEKGGSKGGNSGLGKRAMGGPVNFGEMYLVGEQGPELFSPFANGQIIPNHKISAGGGGDTYVVSVNVSGSLLANRRDIEEAVIVGLESAQRRGRLRSL